MLSVPQTRWLALVSCHLALASMTLGHAGEPPITAVAFAPDGKQVLLGSQAGIQIRSWPELEPIEKTIATQLVHVHDLAFAPDGRHLLVAGGAPAEQGAIEVLSWPEAEPIRRIAEHDDVVYRVAWSPNAKEWVSAGGDGACQVFSSDTGQRLARFAGHSRAVLAVCYLPDGQTIASAGADQTIQLWNSRSGAHLRTLDNHLAAVNDLAIRPAARADATERPTLASVSDDYTVRLWQPTIGRLVRFARLPSIAQAVAWTPAGDALLVGCHDGRVRAIDPETAAMSELFSGPEQRIYAMAVAPDGSNILAAGDRQPFRVAR